MPKISVIVPVYKVEEYLRRCVDSILNQTFQDFELILVDDGSPDNCPQICDEYAQKDNRVFVIHKENGGLSDARNKGIDWAFENSDSEWITFIDSDDWVYAQYLELLYKGVIENNCEISSCRYYSTKGELPEEKGSEIKILFPEDFWTGFGINAVAAWGKLYKKKLWENYRFPKGKIHEDQYTTYKLIFSTNKIFLVTKELYYYFSNEKGITKSKWSPQRMVVFDAKKEQISFFKKNRLDKARIITIKSLANLYSSNIHLAYQAQRKKEYYFEINQMQKALGKWLLKNKRIFPIYQYVDYYVTAYPKMKKIIYFIERVETCIIRKFKNN